MSARKTASTSLSREERITQLTDTLHRYLHFLEDELDELWVDLK